ncbi:MAG: hypothetical protein ACPGVA_14235 [Pikeienuella sp.]
MDRYHIDCAVIWPSACAVTGMIIAISLSACGVAPVLTPYACEVFSWWPTNSVMSGALIGAAAGGVLAAIAIVSDMRRKALIRNCHRGSLTISATELGFAGTQGGLPR